MLLQQSFANYLSTHFSKALSQVLPQANLLDGDLPTLSGAQILASLERTKITAHGDYASNIAMQLAKPLKLNPRGLAQNFVDALLADSSHSDWLDRVEVAGPGFINFYLAASIKQAVVATILQQGDSYGLVATQAPASSAEKIIVEFVSANPTGPLHVGHARQAALGDVLCRLLASQGNQVQREFYYNDAGNQIHNLAISVQARARGLNPDDEQFPADGYRGEYIAEIAEQFMAGATISAMKVNDTVGDAVGNTTASEVTASAQVENLEDIRQFAVAYLRREQDLDLQAFDLQFDHYYLESSLYQDGRVAQVVEKLKASGHTYEHEGALWLRTTALNEGDDKDRVMCKSDGSYTYFVPDVAYHVTKWQRGYGKAINIQGSDHHGTVARVRAGLQALGMGIPKGYPDYVLHKMVKVVRGGQEVKISKRAGSYVTLRDLIEWAGRDAVRFFLVSRKADTEFVFDVDLARKQSDENPVYYVQYAHARICSVLAQWIQVHGGQPHALLHSDFALLTAPSEFALMNRLAAYPALLAQAAQELAPHHLAFYLKDCAADLHSYYNAERVLIDDIPLRHARLALLTATRQVLANGLALIGVHAPERM